MDINTPEEGRELIQQIQIRIEQLEETQKEQELAHFNPINMLGSNIDSGYVCYMAIYVNRGNGGIVKVKLVKRDMDSQLYKFYFVGVDNDLKSEDFKHWKIVNRPDHPYRVNYSMLGPTLVEPIIYSDVDNRRKVNFFQHKN